MVNLFYLDKNPKKCATYYCDKHVNKIMIEICQILCQIHHEIGEKKPPYKRCKAIKDTLKPYIWAKKSINNYLYCCNLANSLLKEFKYRFDKEHHKSEPVIKWLSENIPNKIKKKRLTKFKLTNNVKIYNNYFKNSIYASRVIYVDFKCKNDKWSKRKIPEWFVLLKKEVNTKKNILKKKIMINVKDKLPKFSKKNNLTVRRFHSFLRICYDNLFEDKWNRKIKQMKNMFNEKKPLINQLGLPHLYKILEISNKLFDIKNLNKLNKKSLKFRNKL